MDLRLVRRRDFLCLHLLQVEALEPAVAEDVVGAGLQVAVALREVSGDELLHQRLGVLVEVPAGNEPPWDQGLRVCNSRTLRLRICKV